MITNQLLNYIKEKTRRAFYVKAHGFDHIERVAAFAKKIAIEEFHQLSSPPRIAVRGKLQRGSSCQQNLTNKLDSPIESGNDKKLAELAAWLHDIGRIREFSHNPLNRDHAELSGEIIEEWFRKDKKFVVLSAGEKAEVLYAVRNHNDDLATDFFSAVILRDADKLDLFGAEGMRRHFLWDDNDPYLVRQSLVIQLERVSRLKTKAARRILKERKMLAPLKKYLAEHCDPRKKVLCAISGGVDSAVAAALLIKAGYEVTGAFIKCYNDDTDDADSMPMARITRIKRKSCWIDERRDALRVCAKLGIKLLTFNFEKEYQQRVLAYLFREYKAGRTPNPDVVCNQFIKFPLLLREAKKRGFDYVATGHYARRKRKKEQFGLFQGNRQKDQTYFLHQLKRKYLKDILFPLMRLAKNEVRMFAKQWRLPVAEKEESMGICFIGETPMKEFLMKKIKPKPGKVILSGGEIVGRHDGLAFYTIGQRHLGIRRKASSRPLYVVEKNRRNNELIVGFEDDPLLYKKETLVKKVNWISGQPPRFPLKCQVRLRHRQPLQKCKITQIRGLYADDADNADLKQRKKTVKVIFDKPQRAVTPGQFAVFYKDEECLGGGEIA